MKISNSTVAMNSYSASKFSKSTETSTTTTYHGDGFENSTTVGLMSETYGYKYQSSASLYNTSKYADGDNALSGGNLYNNEDEYSETDEENKEPVSSSEGTNSAASSQAVNAGNNALFDYEDPKVSMLKSMLKLLQNVTSGKFHFTDLKDLQSSLKGLTDFGQSGITLNQSSGMSLKLNNSAEAQREISGGNNFGYWTRKQSVSGTESGTENMTFSSKGTAVTEDGREISFNMTLEMSQSFTNAYSITGDEEEFTMVDPLVINLKNDSAEVTDAHFFFDLNADGKEESVSQLKSGSGFLTLDKNKDGKVNNGSELFGARTGDGFYELSQYDDDGNGWIDENDKVFGELSIWLKNDDGTDTLMGLGEAGVGAIFLGSSAADYSLRNSSGEEAAAVRSTGMFLNENGTAGTIQHVDFRA